MPSSDALPVSPNRQPSPSGSRQRRFSATRVAVAYLIFGLLWIGLTDLLLAGAGGLTETGFRVATGKGTVFVLLSSGIVFWLCRREFRASARANALLRAVIDGTTDAVFVKDRDGRYLLANEAASQIIGRPVAGIIGRDDRELFDSDTAERLIENDMRVMTGSDGVTLEETLTLAGTTKTYQATKAPYRDIDGNVLGLVGIARDITKRKDIEEALRLSEKRFRELSDAIPQILWTAGPDGGLTHVNAKGAEYTGLESGDLAGWSWERVIHPDDVTHAKAEWSGTLGDGLPRPVEMRIRRADGVYRWHICRQRSVRDAAGQIASWVGTNTDIEDLKQAEAALRETDTRLKEAQRIARLGSWSWEPPANRVWWSDAEFKLFGVSESAIHPSFDTFLSLIHPEDRKIAVARVEMMMAGSDEFANDLRIIRPDGTVMWIHSQARATRDAGGRVVRVEGTDQDITERVRAEKALLESERRLRLALEAARAIAFVWDVKNDSVIRYYGGEPALPVTDERVGTLAEVRARIHPDDLRGFDARLAACLATGDGYRNDYRIVRPDSATIYLEEYGFLDREGNGTPLRLTGMTIDVTDRVGAAEALRASEERFREAARVAGVGVFEHDHRTGDFYWSPRLRDIYGYDPDAPADMSAYLAMIHPDDRDAIAAAVGRAHDPDGDGRFDVEHRLIRPSDGRVLWLTTQSKTRFDGEGADRRPVRTVGATVNVTEAREAAEALRQSEERYRLLADSLPTSVHIIEGGRLTYCNPACVALFGAASEAELLGKTPYDLVHPDSHGPVSNRIASIQATGERAPFVVVRIVRVDGQPRTVHAVATPIPNSGHPDAHLVCLNDITEQERSAALLRSVLGSVGDAILTIDSRGSVTSANLATERLFGYAEAELLGGNVSVLMPEPHRRDHDRYLADFLRTGVARVIGVGREVDCLRKDGATFPAELTVTEFSQDGQRNFTGVLRDITARRQLEEQFRQSQKMEAVGRLAGGVAHDFNNLLTVINGYSDMLLGGLTAGDPAREPLAEIQDAGERAARLTQQLLAFSRKSVVEPRLVDLNELVTESGRLLRRLIGEDISLAVLTGPAPVRVVIDPGQFEQVLMNLAVNARDAMPTGGRLTIETTAGEVGAGGDRRHPELPPGRYATLRVSDTGCGMSEEVRGKIFEPFFTTKEIGKGTGLGLAVVHGVVRQAGGSVAVESVVGAGTTFTVLLPAAAGATANDVLGVTRVAPRGTETLLVVEDEEAVRTFVRVALEGLGYAVIPAAGGKEALELFLANRDRVDLLVTDVIMPGISGRVLAEAARKARTGLRVLYMSGYTDDALDRHGLEGTADRFIQKPFTPHALARKVREILDQSE